MDIALLNVLQGSQFHFGVSDNPDNSLNRTSLHPHSDALFSAIVVECAKLFPTEVEKLIQSFRSGNLKISSAFFFLKLAHNTIYFLPRPVNATLYTHNNYKQIKKISFVSSKIIQKGMPVKNWSSDEFRIIDDIFLIHQSELHGDSYENLSIINENIEPKVLVRNKLSEDSLYNQTNVQFSRFETNMYAKTGYYFMYEIIDESVKQLFLTLIKSLVFCGIGGQRSTGCGQIQSVELLNDQSFDYYRGNEQAQYLNLSLLNPLNQAELDQCKYYNTIIRGGRYIGEGKKLKIVRMITEGSILNKELSGNIIDIGTDDSSVHLRYGKPFCLALPRSDKSI